MVTIKINKRVKRKIINYEQTIKHRRGKLESIKGPVTPINGELIIISGSDLSVHQEGLLFVGVEGNVLTPSNKILTGSTAHLMLLVVLMTTQLMVYLTMKQMLRN